MVALQYADDIVVYATSDRVKDCRNLVEGAVKQLDRAARIRVSPT